VEEDRKKLEAELLKLQKAYEALQLESIEKNNSLKNANKRAKVEEQHRKNTKHCLEVTYAKRDRARERKCRLEALLANTQSAYDEVFGQLENFKSETKKMVSEYKDKIR